MKVKTTKQVRTSLRAKGITITEWSRKHGFDRYTVTDLLRGKRKGNYGEAHRAAVALGLKTPEGSAST